MTSDVLGSQFNATVRELSCPPLPASAIDKLPALLAIASVPTSLPVAGGANVTFKTAVCPGGTVVLPPTPLAPKPEPVTSTLLMMAFAFPVFVRVTPSELLLPTTTLPKSKLAVLAPNTGAEITPLPLAEIASGELGALLSSEMEPVAFPAELGANTTLKVMFWPGAMLIGTVSPDVLKPAPVTLALEIVTFAVPLFCSVIVCELLEPVATPGKLALVGVAESCGWTCGCGCGVFGSGAVGAALLEALDGVTTPAQPLLKTAAARTTPKTHFDTLLTSDRLSAIVGQV